MVSITRDPLLAIAKGVLWFLMGAMLLAGAACLVALPAVIIGQDRIVVALASNGLHAPGGDLIGAICLILVLVIGLVAMLFQVFRLLKQIVDTVGEGDPFVPENARRLTAMAWLTLAVQLIALPIAGIAMWVRENIGGEFKGEFKIDDGFSGNGLLLMLILFVLARVFRQGAAMRDELEGTV